MKLKKADRIIISLFLILEILIYLSFLLLDKNVNFIEIDSSYFKYAGIILCLVFSLYSLIRKRSLEAIFIPCALVFTLISDCFLLLNPDPELFIYGLVTFIITQLIYFLFLSFKNKSLFEFILNIVIRLILTLVAIVVAVSLGYKDTLTLLALSYFVELLANFIYSFSLIKLDKKFLIFSTGLLLFIGCDISVGLNNVHLFDGIDYSLVNYMMWVFYLPSQVLLSISSIIPSKNLVKLG